MATLHLPSQDKVIMSRTETRKKFDELSDWDKMMLSRAAMRALFMDNPDVILTIDKLKVLKTVKILTAGRSGICRSVT